MRANCKSIAFTHDAADADAAVAHSLPLAMAVDTVVAGALIAAAAPATTACCSACN